MRSVLEYAGYEVREAADGHDALACLAASTSIGLILTDVDMPRMNGLELIRHLRNDSITIQKGVHIPIVICSSSLSDMPLVTPAVSASFEKPVDFKRLLSAIKEIIQEPN